jgi:hypothetical protein
MERVFKNLEELMDFDFSGLTANKSNYLTILANNGCLPSVRKSQNFSKWRVVERPKDLSNPKVLMEITPRWLTVTVHQGNGLSSRRIDVYRFKRDVKEIIQEIFEI